VRRETYGYLPSRRTSLPRDWYHKLYCLVTEAHVCEQLAQGRYLTAERPGVELATSRVASQRLNHYTARLSQGCVQESLASNPQLKPISLLCRWWALTVYLDARLNC